jgi:hypothetical protein
MARTSLGTIFAHNSWKGAVMGVLFTVLSIALVVAVLGVVAFVLFVEPFVGHTEHFRDARGRRLGSSPRLD